MRETSTSARTIPSLVTADSQEVKDKSLWSALDNANSFWFSRPSLYNILAHTGFTSVYECFTPGCAGQYDNRPTLVAVKGAHQAIVSTGEVGGPTPRLRRPLPMHIKGARWRHLSTIT
jgi:hypothetical protein